MLLFEHVGRTSGGFRADIKPTNSLTDRSIVEIFHHREVRYEYETRETYQLG